MAELFLVFFKIGLFTFGGGYAMIAQIKDVIVEEKGWLTAEELMEVVAIAESTPGPIAINLATYVGYKKYRLRGSISATLGVVLPSMCIIYALSMFLDGFMENEYVARAFRGIQCAVALLILKAGVSMHKSLPANGFTALLFWLSFSVLFVLNLCAVSYSAIWFILAAGVIGFVTYALHRGRGK